MSVDRLDLQSAAERLWKIRRMIRERAVDPLAADTALRPLRQHPNVRVAWLASMTTRSLVESVVGAPIIAGEFLQ